MSTAQEQRLDVAECRVSAEVGVPLGEPWTEAFRAAVEPFQQQLQGVARGILQSEDLAWDAVQEALLAFWQLGFLPPNPRGWLVRAVVHRSLHLRRGLHRRKGYESRACLMCANPAGEIDPLQLLENRDLFGKLLELWEDLSEDHRRILWLREVRELDYESIASTLKISIGTVRSRLARARAACRRSLQPMLGKD